ncbi:MAG: serine/threonine protein kinase, partial [Peptostreptococcaceae bacterium]
MRVGDLLFDGRYRIIEQIAQSKMSNVYLAQNLALGNYWVIKEAKKNTQYNFDLLAEPNILKRLSHPALPRIVDIHEDRECVYIVEDYIRGRSLDKILQEKGKIDEAAVIDLAKQICNVLIYLHKQSPYPIIYRDMKPSNIMLTKENEIKLIDFGIAREYKSENHNDTTYMGSKGYAAPEQYGKSQSDVRTDIYSFGVTMYHLLTGNSPLEPPYEVRKLRTISRRFSEGMEYIVDRCTQNDPDDRYQNVYEVLYDLENIYEFN